MERLPRPDGTSRLVPDVYYASSIHDMLSSNEQVANDIVTQREEWYLTWPSVIRRPLDAYEAATNRADRVIYKALRRTPPVRREGGMSFVDLPHVRHDPRKDQASTSRTITIFDQTAECEVQLPDWKWERLLQSSGLNIDSKVLQDRNWAGRILLFSRFEPVGKNEYKESRTLLHVDNEYATKKDPEEVFNLARKLAPRLIPR